MIAWNLTGQNISIFMDGDTYTIPRDHRHAADILTALEAEDRTTVLRYLDAKRQISVETEGRIGYDGRSLTFNGEEIHNAIMDRLHFLWSNGLPYTSLLRFMDRLMDNPSNRAVNELYRFLEACELPITNDGYFLAYKRVRENFTDIHSGKFDNSVGATPRLRRNQVDEDSERTCSHGLHVCSAGYLPSFSYSGPRDRIVVVKVDPKDVVAVPRDYNNAKMRVCAYEVIDDVSDRFHEFGGNEILPRHFTPDYSDVDEGWDDELDELVDEYDDPWGLDETDDPIGDLADLADLDEDEDEDDAPVQTGPSVHATTSKLNEQQVREIKDMLATGKWAIVRLAEVFNVNESTIRKIRDGETWTWVS